MAMHSMENMYISYTRATTIGDLLRVQAQMNADRRLKENFDIYNENNTNKNPESFMSTVVTTNEKENALLEHNIIGSQEKSDDDFGNYR